MKLCTISTKTKHILVPALCLVAGHAFASEDSASVSEVPRTAPEKLVALEVAGLAGEESSGPFEFQTNGFRGFARGASRLNDIAGNLFSFEDVFVEHTSFPKDHDEGERVFVRKLGILADSYTGTAHSIAAEHVLLGMPAEGESSGNNKLQGAFETVASIDWVLAEAGYATGLSQLPDEFLLDQLRDQSAIGILVQASGVRISAEFLNRFTGANEFELDDFDRVSMDFALGMNREASNPRLLFSATFSIDELPVLSVNGNSNIPGSTASPDSAKGTLRFQPPSPDSRQTELAVAETAAARNLAIAIARLLVETGLGQSLAQEISQAADSYQGQLLGQQVAFDIPASSGAFSSFPTGAGMLSVTQVPIEGPVQ